MMKIRVRRANMILVRKEVITNKSKNAGKLLFWGQLSFGFGV